MRLSILVLLLCCGCGGAQPPPAAELTVSAASSLRDVVAPLAALYQAEHPEVRVLVNFAASGALQRQIEHGAAVDVFVSAADRPMEALAQRGRVDPGTRRVVAGNRLVLIAPRTAAPALRGVDDLAAPAVQRVAIGAPASVPVGAYAREALRHHGVWEAVEPRLVLAAHARQVLAYVERGEVDAGLVYATDARASDRVRVVDTLSAAAHSPIRYRAAVVAESRHPAEARRFLDFLESGPARRLWRRHGFSPPPADGV